MFGTFGFTPSTCFGTGRSDAEMEQVQGDRGYLKLWVRRRVWQGPLQLLYRPTKWAISSENSGYARRPSLERLYLAANSSRTVSASCRPNISKCS